ncbi:MAG: phosphate/phosphite/phosphonate ABC transporter substrate-binding protein [Spirochaetales bacterium]|nr:phosphate/phosphite/phosphonate ABC transporter substrate-binding protein [Spirochaetales bacterium]
MIYRVLSHHMKINSQYLIIVFFFLLNAFFPWDLSSEELNFGYSSGENIVSIINKFTPMMNYISEKTGMKVNFIRTISYSETQEAFTNGVLDMGILNTVSFLAMENRDVVVAIAERLKKGINTYNSFIVTRRDSPIEALYDLQGKIFAFGDPDSTSATLMPRHLLLESGLDIDRDLKQFIYFQKQDSILYAILNRTVDAGAVASFIFEESDPELKDLLKIVVKSKPMPLGPFVVSKNLDADLIDNLIEILLSMNQSPEGVKALKKADLEGFTVFKDDDYDSLRELYSRSDNK